MKPSSRDRDQPSQQGAFFASRLVTLAEFRHKVYRLGESIGQPIWVSEHSAPELVGLPLDQVQVACLRKVRSYKRFICVLDGSYGATWNASEVSILELELFMAALTQREISIFLIGPYDADPRLASLLKVIRLACPQSLNLHPMSKEDILAIIARMLDSKKSEKITMLSQAADILGHFVQFFARFRSPKIQPRFSELDIQFLNADYAPISTQHPEKDRIESLIDGAMREKNIPNSLAQLWPAIRHLSAAPPTESRYAEYLPLWEKALSQWASASAWYNLHGHMYLGRLAAVNSLLRIRSQMSTTMQSELGLPSIQGMQGAIASEYYSIAKLVNSLRDRHSLLKKALYNVNEALKTQQNSDISGLLAIRGSILLSLGHPLKAVSDYSESLRQRYEANEDPGRIGEMQVELGMAYLCIGRIWKAQKLFEAGIENF